MSPGSVTQDAGYFSAYRTGEVGYHLFNNGGVAEWVMRQPASTFHVLFDHPERKFTADMIIALIQGCSRLAGQ